MLRKGSVCLDLTDGTVSDVLSEQVKAGLETLKSELLARMPTRKHGHVGGGSSYEFEGHWLI